MCHTYDDASRAWLAAKHDLDLASSEVLRALERERRAAAQEAHARAVMHALFATLIERKTA